MQLKKYYSYDEVLGFFNLFDLIDLLRTRQIRIAKYYQGEMDILVARKDNPILNFGKTDSYTFHGYIKYTYNEKLVDGKTIEYFTYNDIYETTLIFAKKEYQETEDLKYWHRPSSNDVNSKIYDELSSFSFIKDDIDEVKSSFYKPSDKTEIISQVPLLYLNETLTTIEAACIISGDIPSEIEAILENKTLLSSYTSFLSAKSFIDSSIRLSTLMNYSDIGIATHEFKVFLKSKNIFINGFNDEIKDKDCIEQLHDQLAINQTRIAELESELNFYQSLEQNSNIKAQSNSIENLLTYHHPALDNGKSNHAPELLLAIQAWEAKYLNNEYPHHEHTPAIKMFLTKIGYTGVRLQERIAAITNPKNINKS